MQNILEDFSAGYWFVPDLEVTTYGGNHAIMQDDVFEDLLAATGSYPLVGHAANSRFRLYPDAQMPSHLVALPERARDRVRDGDCLLIPKTHFLL
jgi:hypothetical protein